MRVASWGGGVNSTAMLVGCVEKGMKVDLILFADTGGEKPETYGFLDEFDLWLQAHGMVGVTRVSNAERSIYASLEQECLTRRTLPALAFGWRSCSDKWKKRPQDRYLHDHGIVVDEWLIGFDAGESRRVERAVADLGRRKRFPLVEWKWYREDCVKAIQRAGLAVPVKSACFFCPASTKPEILKLKREHPELFERAREMERGAEGLKAVKGLGRHWNWGEVEEKVCLPVIEQTCMCFDEGEE